MTRVLLVYIPRPERDGMGRHTRKLDRGSRPDAGEDDRSRRSRRIGKVPLMPTVTGILAIGAIVSAVSTQQISLNFAGGTPPSPPSPLVTGSTRPQVKHGRHTARDDSSTNARGRASREHTRSAVTVAFRRTSAWATGF